MVALVVGLLAALLFARHALQYGAPALSPWLVAMVLLADDQGYAAAAGGQGGAREEGGGINDVGNLFRCQHESVKVVGSAGSMEQSDCSREAEAHGALGT